jgi:hypothetical protein
VGVVVSFPSAPPASSVTVTLPLSGGHWLNIPSGAYPSASVTPNTPIRLCEVAPKKPE